MNPFPSREISMPTYEVSLLTRGGADAHTVSVRATSPDQAKEAAVATANARAQASGKSYQYHATHVREK
jgi:hypothetical protein